MAYVTLVDNILEEIIRAGKLTNEAADTLRPALDNLSDDLYKALAPDNHIATNDFTANAIKAAEDVGNDDLVGLLKIPEFSRILTKMSDEIRFDDEVLNALKDGIDIDIAELSKRYPNATDEFTTKLEEFYNKTNLGFKNAADNLEGADNLESAEAFLRQEWGGNLPDHALHSPKATRAAKAATYDDFPEFSSNHISSVKNIGRIGFSDNYLLPKINIYPAGAQKPDAREILDPLIKYYSDKMNKVNEATGFSITEGIKGLNSNVLDAVKKGASEADIQKLINDFGTKNKEALEEFSANMTALKNHVEDTYKTNVEITTTPTKAGTDETRRSTDFITRQKDATIKWLDHTSDMALDLVKGSDGELGKEMLHNAERARGDRVLFNKFENSVTGLNGAVEIAERESIRSTKKYPDGSKATKDYINQIRENINSGYYLKESRGLDALPSIKSTDNKEVRGNLAYTAFNDLISDFTKLDKHGNPIHDITDKMSGFPKFLDAVDTLGGAGNFAEAFDSIYFISKITYSEAHKKNVLNMVSDAGWKEKLASIGKYDPEKNIYIGSSPREIEFYKAIEDHLKRNAETIASGNPESFFGKFTTQYLRADSREAVTKATRTSHWQMMQDRFGYLGEKVAFEGRQEYYARRTYELLDGVGFLMGATTRKVPIEYKFGTNRLDFANSAYVWKGDSAAGKVWNAGVNIFKRSISGGLLENYNSNIDLTGKLNIRILNTNLQTTKLGGVAAISGTVYGAGEFAEGISDEFGWNENIGDVGNIVGNIGKGVFEVATIPLNIITILPNSIWNAAFDNGVGHNITNGIMPVTDLNKKRLDTEEIDEALYDIQGAYDNVADKVQDAYNYVRQQKALITEELRQASRQSNNEDEINRLTTALQGTTQDLDTIKQIQNKMEEHNKVIQASVDTVDSNSLLGLGIWHKDEKRNLPSAKVAYAKAYDSLTDVGVMLESFRNGNYVINETAEQKAIETPVKTAAETPVKTAAETPVKTAAETPVKVVTGGATIATAETAAVAKLAAENATVLGAIRYDAAKEMTSIKAVSAKTASNVEKADKYIKDIETQIKSIEAIKEDLEAKDDGTWDKAPRMENLRNLIIGLNQSHADANTKIAPLKAEAIKALETEASAVVLIDQINAITDEAEEDSARSLLSDLEGTASDVKTIGESSKNLLNEISAIGQNNIKIMGENTDYTHSSSWEKQRDDGLRALSGGSENGALYQMFGSPGNGATSWFGGVFNTVAGNVKGFASWWDDMERNTTSKGERNALLGGKIVGLGLLGVMALNMVNGIFFGGKMGSGWKWGIGLTMAGILLHKSGAWGDRMENLAKDKSSFAQGSYLKNTTGSTENVQTPHTPKSIFSPNGKKIASVNIKDRNGNNVELNIARADKENITVQGPDGKIPSDLMTQANTNLLASNIQGSGGNIANNISASSIIPITQINNSDYNVLGTSKLSYMDNASNNSENLLAS